MRASHTSSPHPYSTKIMRRPCSGYHYRFRIGWAYLSILRSVRGQRTVGIDITYSLCYKYRHSSAMLSTQPRIQERVSWMVPIGCESEYRLWECLSLYVSLNIPNRAQVSTPSQPSKCDGCRGMAFLHSMSYEEAPRPKFSIFIPSLDQVPLSSATERQNQLEQL
jgi:hypothetical protein